MTVAIDKQKPFRWLLVAMLLVLAAGLSYAVLSLPAQSPGLTAYVAENIKTSGVSNPVTAVLLNFRAYDTLLEMGVLLLALLGTWSLSNVPEQRAASPLGAAGVLLLLVGWYPGTRFTGLALRIALVMGMGTFIAAGIVFMLVGRRMLEYPPPFAAALILLIEAAATLSIGITLAALFLGGRPEKGPQR